MNAKQYLRQLKSLKQMIDVKQEQIQMLNDMCMKVTSTIKEDVVQESGGKDKISDAVAKIVDLENELSNDIERFRVLMIEITDKIEMIPDDDLKVILKHKYVNMMTFEQISDKLNISVRWVYENHQRAIKAFEVVLSLII